MGGYNRSKKDVNQGRIHEFVQGGAQHPFGHENPLKSIDFTGPGWGLAPIAPPEYASGVNYKERILYFSILS